MKRQFKIIKANLFPPVGDLKKIKDDLNFLQKEMKEIEMMGNKVEATVRLFEIISPLQDKGGFSQAISKLQEKNYGQLDKIISALEVLQKHFGNAGRSEFGMNRTKVGEEVTSSKIFLGDVFGLFTKSAFFWLEKENECKKELRPDISNDHKNPVSNWYIINDHQAGSFVKSHTEGILKQVSFLLEKIAA